MNSGAQIPDLRLRTAALTAVSILVMLFSVFIAVGRQNRPVIIVDCNIDINKAPVESLVRLPGVGYNTAEDIIAYRQTCGKAKPFERIEDLRAVKGIGVKKSEAMRPYISFE